MTVKTPTRRQVKSKMLPGVSYLLGPRGTPEAVVIDLKKHASLWEDFQDLLVAKSRRKDARVSLEEVEEGLRKLGKLK